MDAGVAAIVEQVREAASRRAPLRIRGGDSKRFYGRACDGDPLDVRGLTGIVSHEPSELVVTVRAGTPLAELEAVLAGARQVLAFEPPHFGAGATVGGCIAAGLSGPRRMAYGPIGGAVRDHLLGARLVDGRGRLLHFGGTVMKNVAGYDVARALAGSLGVLGVIVEVSLKVLPAPEAEITLAFALEETAALERMTEWGMQPLPVSATFWHDGRLLVRLSGMPAALQAARTVMGGEVLAADAATGQPLWTSIREQTHAGFAGAAPLWRVSLPPNSPALGLGDPQCIEWLGTQRWLRSALPADVLRGRAQALGGHATRFRADAANAMEPFAPLAPALAALQSRLKREFDPQQIFNRGRMYAEL